MKTLLIALALTVSTAALTGCSADALSGPDLDATVETAYPQADSLGAMHNQPQARRGGSVRRPGARHNETHEDD